MAVSVTKYCDETVCYRSNGHDGDHMTLSECVAKWSSRPGDSGGFGPGAEEAIPASGSAFSDSVLHPAHYTSGKIEVWDFILDQKLDYLLGNVIKYVCRWNSKGDALENLKKAKAYIDRKIREVEESRAA